MKSGIYLKAGTVCDNTTYENSIFESNSIVSILCCGKCVESLNMYITHQQYFLGLDQTTNIRSNIIRGLLPIPSSRRSEPKIISSLNASIGLLWQFNDTSNCCKHCFKLTNELPDKSNSHLFFEITPGKT